MTTYDDMPAGRELDALVAEKIFGLCRWDGVPNAFHPKVVQWWQTEQPCNPPPYSTDIAAAWEIVEKLRLAIGPSYCGSGWYCTWMTGGAHGAIADSAPLAICRAALREVGV